MSFLDAASWQGKVFLNGWTKGGAGDAPVRRAGLFHRWQRQPSQNRAFGSHAVGVDSWRPVLSDLGQGRPDAGVN